MQEFDDEDAEINRPLDKRFVIAGLSMMVFGLVGTVYFEMRIIKWICVVSLFTSYFVMTKKEDPRT
jgi:hypothetical protein